VLYKAYGDQLDDLGDNVENMKVGCVHGSLWEDMGWRDDGAGLQRRECVEGAHTHPFTHPPTHPTHT